MKFTITNIASERSINGKTIYYAVSEDNKQVNITLPNMVKVTPDLLKRKLNEVYTNMVNESYQVQIGDVIGE